MDAPRPGSVLDTIQKSSALSTRLIEDADAVRRERDELRRALFGAALTIDTLLGMIETGDRHQGTREAAAVTKAEAYRLTALRRAA